MVVIMYKFLVCIFWLMVCDLGVKNVSNYWWSNLVLYIEMLMFLKFGNYEF